MERRDVAMVYLLGEFMQVNMDKTVHMETEDKMADLLVIKQLEERYRNEAPLTIWQGNIVEFLGMTLDFSFPNKVIITVFDYIKKMLDKLLDDFDGEAATQ
eukprot:9201462-Ditylum_brightwellii.AAC.1